MSRREEREREFEEFAVARTPGLYRSAVMLCGNSHLAEDLVQETLAKVYVKWRQPLGRIENPAAYAHTVLTRTFISHRRRRGTGAEILSAELPEAASEDAMSAATTRLVLGQALDGLSRIDRAVVVLRYLEDLSVDETAGRLDISPGAVKNRSMRALQRLRDVVTTNNEGE